ncbi:unnamed protein product [Merluccius merluccius]
MDVGDRTAQHRVLLTSLLEVDSVGEYDTVTMADYNNITTGIPYLAANATSTPGNGSLDEGLPASGSLHAVLGVFLTAMLAMVVFSLGCTVEASKLWFHLRRPWGVLVGLGCQFGLMPLTAYLLASGFGVRPLQAVAVVMMGCCPGGVISNIVTYWLDGDMDLSITMTTCSTMLALGMMPLCLYAYTHFWVETAHIKIPYSNMGITLLTLVVPAACGVAVNYKWPKAAKCILKVGSVVGGVMILVVGVASALMYHGSWQTDTSLILIASIFPLIGYSAGFVIAVICRQPWPRCRTIAMETGAQNVQISSTMLQLSFPPEQLVVMFTFPLMYGCFQLLHSLLLVSVYQLWKHVHVWRSGKGGGGEEIQSVPDRREHLDDVIHAGRGETNAAFEHDAARRSDGPVPRAELGPKKQDADVKPAATPSRIQDDATSSRQDRDPDQKDPSETQRGTRRRAIMRLRGALVFTSAVFAFVSVSRAQVYEPNLGRCNAVFAFVSVSRAQVYEPNLGRSGALRDVVAPVWWEGTTPTNSTPPSNSSSVSRGLLQGFCFLGVSVVGFGSAMVPIQHLDVGDGMFFQLVFCSTMGVEALVVFLIRGCPQIWALGLLAGVLYSLAFLAASVQFVAYYTFFEACYHLGTIITYPIGSTGTKNFLILAVVIVTVVCGVTLITLSKIDL